jgi:predicted RNA binding protein YcfA (HicA-like mRNA interferase family)
MGRMAGVHADRMIRALERLGWTLVRSRGSHHALVKDGHPRPLIVPVKKGRTLPEGTARGILKEAGLSEDQFFAVYR